MQDFCFFKKGRHIAALERSDAEQSALLTEGGWEKLFEEVSAADAESALARLADMRKEESTTDARFCSGFSIYSAALLTAISK